MKNLLIVIALFSASVLYSQTKSKKNYEKFKFGAGVEAMNYVGYNISTQGILLQLESPIYYKLGALLSYSNQSDYLDYCDDIPVLTSEKHFVIGLKYNLLEKNKWAIEVIGGLDLENVSYVELEQDPIIQVQNHNERLHEEEVNHSENETFTEVLIGAQFGYQIHKNFQFNFSTRINSYGSFRNSIRLNYLFDLGKGGN